MQVGWAHFLRLGGGDMMPPGCFFQSISNWEETQEQTQNALKGLISHLAGEHHEILLEDLKAGEKDILTTLLTQPTVPSTCRKMLIYSFLTTKISIHCFSRLTLFQY